MPATKPKKTPSHAKSKPSTNGIPTTTGPVLTLTEAAAYCESMNRPCWNSSRNTGSLVAESETNGDS